MNKFEKVISIIIPVLNEAENIKDLIKRLSASLDKNRFKYEIIFIDDNSSDNTVKVINQFKKDLPIIIKNKKGKKGKAFSLVEGISYAHYENIGFIDADLQYPPEAIAKMCYKLKSSDIVVANRKIYNAPFLRKFVSDTFKYTFGKLLFGLDYDIQSGLKVFKKEVIKVIDFTPVSGWTFDLEFLHKAREAGFKIATEDVSFEKRKKGNSKVNFLKSSIELGSNALKLRFKKNLPIYTSSLNKKTMRGAGILFNKKKYITHSTLPYQKSALTTFTMTQKLLIVSLIFFIIVGLLLNILTALGFLITILSFIYFIDMIFNLYIVTKSLKHPNEIFISRKRIENVNENNLPIYTILCPLYKESHILEQFIKNIKDISWPKEKLDVLLLLEEDDKESILKARKMNLPSFVRIIVVPNSEPKTKPKACNYGLSYAKGEYIVIYDAEDKPDIFQLKKAYLAFKNGPKSIACYQAKLNYYNSTQNLLTRFFTAEYSLWFGITLTGFQSINTSIPLGGTSNHFRTKDIISLHGWDSFNVTEDADLGIRLFKEGHKTAIIDSVTLEEANSKWGNWIRQRSRWIKGYMQTYLVHTRESLKFAKERKLHFFIFHMVVGGKIAFILINPLLWLATISYFTLYQFVGPTIESLYPTYVFYIAVFSLTFGNFLFFYYYLIALAKREDLAIMKYVFLIPVYWLMISVAGTIALYQLFFKPFYWEKTIHGLHLKRKTSGSTVEENVIAKPFIPVPSFGLPSSAFLKVRPSLIISFHKPIFLILITIGSLTEQIINSLKSTLILIGDMEQVGFNYLIIVSKKVLLVPFKAIYYFYLKLISLKFNFLSFIDLFRKDENKNNEPGLSILIFNWRDTKHEWAGGAENYIHELSKQWVKDGNRVTIFCGNDEKNSRRATLDGVNIIRRGGFYSVYFWALIYYIFKLRKNTDILIDSENGIPFFTPLYSSKPIILLIHHIHQDIFMTELKFPLSYIGRFIEGKLMPMIYRNSTIVTVSESSKNAIAKLKLSVKQNIQIVHPGININNKEYSKKKNPTFIYLGRLKPYKNIDIAIKAFKFIESEIANAKLLLVGDGESKEKLEKLVIKLNLSEKVKFYGKVTENMKIKLLSQSWVALQPSKIEGWGLTVIEANACKTPVIATNTEGLKDSIINGKTGILVKHKDIEGFASGMLKLSKNETARTAMSKRAFEWSKNFNWVNSANEFMTVITNERLRERYIIGTRQINNIINRVTAIFNYEK